MARLKEWYVSDVAPALMKKFTYKSVIYFTGGNMLIEYAF